MRLKTVLILKTAANAVLVLGQVATVTLFELEPEGLGWGGITVEPEGVNTNGATTYSFGIPITAMRTRGGQTFVPTETWRGTLVQDAFHHVVTAGPTNTDDLGAYGECQFSYAGGVCAWAAWSSQGSTISYTITGSVVPFYTLIVTPTPTPVTSPSSTIPTSVVTTTLSGANTPTISSGSTTARKKPIGAIVGGVIGGVIGSLVIIALVAYLLRRRFRSRRGPKTTSGVFEHDTYVMPFYSGIPSESGEFDNSAQRTGRKLPVDKAAGVPFINNPPNNSPTQTGSLTDGGLDIRSELSALRAAVEGLGQQQRMLDSQPPSYDG